VMQLTEALCLSVPPKHNTSLQLALKCLLISGSRAPQA
jgi:hypothetical protein